MASVNEVSETIAVPEVVRQRYFDISAESTDYGMGGSPIVDPDSQAIDPSEVTDYLRGGYTPPEHTLPGGIELENPSTYLSETDYIPEYDNNEGFNRIVISFSGEGPGPFPANQLAASLYKVIFPLGVLIGFIAIVFAGYKFMTSQGSPDKVKGASDQLTSAIAGVIFIALSLGILQFIMRSLF